MKIRCFVIMHTATASSLLKNAIVAMLCVSASRQQEPPGDYQVYTLPNFHATEGGSHS